MYTLIYKHIHSHGFVDATVQSTINTKEHSAAKKTPAYNPISVYNHLLYGRRRGRHRPSAVGLVYSVTCQLLSDDVVAYPAAGFSPPPPEGPVH